MRINPMLLAVCFAVVAIPAQANRMVVVECKEWEKAIPLTLWRTASTFTDKVGAVSCGDSVTVLSDVSSMTKVRTEDGKEGYLTGRAVGYIGPLPTLPKLDKKFQKVRDKHPAWPPAMVEAVEHHQVVVGMNYEMLQASIGNWPLHVNTTYLQGGHTSVQLVYDICNCITDALHFTYFYGYVYLEDGIVTAIQTSR